MRHEEYIKQAMRQSDANEIVSVADRICEKLDQIAEPKKERRLPDDPEERKAIPIYTGFIRYFPDAIAAVAKVSLKGGIQHGQTPQTLHWDRTKSSDELDAMMRHVIDEDWSQVAWRALANLQKQIEKDKSRGKGH